VKVPTFKVVATRQGPGWRITYVNPCPHCRKRHYHGGGDGPEPFMGNGVWSSHCPFSRGEPVKLVLVKS
jgi:hypothetical protein